MSIINYLSRTIRLKVMNLKRFPVFIVGALLLLQSGATNARSLVVRDVARTVEVQTIPTHQGVDLHYVGLIRIIYKCPMDELFPSVKVAMERSFVRLAGLRQDKYYCFHLSRMMEKKMHDEILTDLEKKVLIGKKLGVFDDFAGQQLLKCFSYGIQDKFIVGQIEKRVGHAQRKIALSGCPFLPPKLRHGDFVFGYDLWNNKILTDVQFFNSHTLILGDTGAGKSNLSKFHCIQMAMSPAVKSVILVDVRKREYRTLRPIFARMGLDLKIIRGRKFRINPLQVADGVDPIEYAALASDILVRVLNLPPRASTLLSSTIIKLYAEHGILNGGYRYPTLFDLHRAIRADRDANPQARQATLDNLEEILLALGPDILAYHQGWSPHELFRQHIVIELTGLPEKAKDLILNYLISAEFIYRIAKGYSNRLMDTFLAVDEGKRLLSLDKDTSTYGGNALIDLMGLLRGASLGLQINVLSSNDLSRSIPNLTSTKIFGRCGSISEYTAAGHFIGLDSEQITWCAHHMVPGMFVGQVSGGQWRYPFLFHVPLVNQIGTEHESVSDQEADESIKNIVSQRALPA
jgi:hypothetical protein